MGPEDDGDLGLAVEGQQRTFDQAMELWVFPEIARRRALGLIEGAFELTAAQVIMRHGEPPEVRLNEEIAAVGRLKLAKEVRAGDPVMANNIEAVNKIVLTDADPDAAHLTMINFAGVWTLAFDFRYNATKARHELLRAEEFLATAEEAFKSGRLRAAADTLFSAVELMATAELMLLPVEAVPKDSRYKHQYVAMVLNRRGKAGLLGDSAVSAAAFNRLSDLRVRGRYQPAPFDAIGLAELLEHARAKSDDLVASLPERAVVDPAFLASKPKSPPRSHPR